MPKSKESLPEPKVVNIKEAREEYLYAVENAFDLQADLNERDLLIELKDGESVSLFKRSSEGKSGRKRKIPLQLPIDYDPTSYSPMKAHNQAQLILFSDESETDLSKLFQASVQSISQNCTVAIAEVLPQEKRERKISLTKADETELYANSAVRRITSAIKSGIGTYEGLIKAGFKPSEIQAARTQINSRERKGVTVPLKEVTSTWDQLYSQLQDPEISLEEKCKIMDKVNVPAYKLGTRRKRNLFTSLSKVVKEAGLKKPTRSLLNLEDIELYLRSVNCPVGRAETVLKGGKNKGKKQIYRFVLTEQVDDVVEILSSISEEDVLDWLEEQEAIY